MKNFLSFIFELVKIIVISLAIILPVRYYLIQPFYVKGASMEPNFYDHEYLIIDEISYRFHEPERGDIIVFKYPENPQEYFIKRIIGLPGESVKVNNNSGEVVVYNDANPEGQTLSEPYLADNTKTYVLEDETVKLGDDEYYVMGDNRTSSKDSRNFGPVKESFVIGRVMLRGWPFGRIGFFETPVYEMVN